jgi:hypothetical protein
MPLGCVDQGAILRRPDPHVGPMDDNIQEQAECIEQDVPLAAGSRQPSRPRRSPTGRLQRPPVELVWCLAVGPIAVVWAAARPARA